MQTCFTDKLNEKLDLSKTFLDHKLQQVTLLSKTDRPVGLSSVDVIALKRYDSRNQHVNNKYYASHSVSGVFSRYTRISLSDIFFTIFFRLSVRR